MVGFLLEDDAVTARKNQFEAWIDEQRRATERAAQQAQSTVQQARSTVQQSVEASADQVAQRTAEFQNWLGTQNAPPTAPTAPQPATPSSSAPSGIASLPQAETPEEQQRANQFSDWLTQLNRPPLAGPGGAATPSAPSTTGPAPETQGPSQPAPEPSRPVLDASGRTFPLAGFKPGSNGNNEPHSTYHGKGGSDLMAPRGTPVVSMAGGTVIGTTSEPANAPGSTIGGNTVLVRGDDGLEYYYAHLDQAPQLQQGQRVQAGDPLGVVGNSGNAYKGGQGETHLHIGIGRGISNGQGADGGLGQDYDAQGALTQLLSTSGDAPRASARVSPHEVKGGVRTTAELSGGGSSGGMTDRAQSILNGAADIARAFGEDAVKAVQSVLVTEGGLNNARGDNAASAGPLQFFGEEGGRGGQLNNLASQLGMTLEQARKWVEDNPLAAVRWAIGTPDRPGYLGQAIMDGINAGRRGAELATFVQANGQRSVSPERAGQNYNNLFGQGQSAITGVGSIFDTLGRSSADVASRAQQLATESGNLVKTTGDRAQQTLDQLNQLRAQTQAGNERWIEGRRAEGATARADIMAPRRFDLMMGENQPADQAGFRAPDVSAMLQDVRDRLSQGIPVPQGAQDVARRTEDLLQQYPEVVPGRTTQGQPLERRILGGADPYEAIVERGVPQVVRGVQQRNLEDVVMGALESVLGAGAVLPGGAGEAAVPKIADAIKAAAPELAERAPALVAPAERTVTEGGLNLATRQAARVSEVPWSQESQALLRQGPAGTAGRGGRAYDELGRRIPEGLIENPLTSKQLGQPYYDRYGVFQREPALYSERGIAMDPVTGREIVPADVALGGAALRQAAQANPRFAAQLGLTAGGGALGYATAPEDATPEERMQRALGGAAAAGALAFGGPRLAEMSPTTRAQAQDVATWLRANAPSQSTAKAVGQALGPQTGGERVAEWISSNLLSGPGLVWNVVTQGMHLGWQPLLRAAEGHPIEALRGFQAMVAAVPEALERGGAALARGEGYAGVGGQQSRPLAKTSVGLRANMAGDAVLRTLNENMGGMLEAQRLIRQAGATSPQAAQGIIAQNAGRIAQAAAGEGARSALTTGSARTPWLRDLGTLKTNLLRDTNPLKQVAGVLLHVGMPFARVPEEVLYQVLRNSPGVGQLIDALQIVKAAPGDSRREATAKAALNAAMSAAIIGAALNDQIRGGDDPEHPNAANIGGQWLPLSSLGTLGGRMAVTTAVIDGLRKQGTEPTTTAMDRIARAVNNVGKLAEQEYPLAGQIRLLSRIGQGNLTGAATGFASDLLGGLTPVSGALGGAENVLDPYARQTATSGLGDVYEPNLARIPGVANLLPTQVNMLTGEPLRRPSSGPGALLRVQNVGKADSPLAREIVRLEKLGYQIAEPKELPTQVNVRGAQIKLNPDEQRALAQARGQEVERLIGDRVRSGDWNTLTDDQKARLLARALNRASAHNTVTWRRMTPASEQRDRIAQGQRVVGRLVAQGGFTAPGTAA